MKTRLLLPAATSLGSWCALVLVVTLLTLLFNVLGTLTCATAIGMMMGACRRGLRRAALASLAPPAVMIALAVIGRSALAGRQVGMLAGICVGVFWLTYLITLGLMHLERKNETAPRRQSGAAVAMPAPAAPASSAATALAEVPTRLGMDFLRGAWRSEHRDASGRIQRRLIEINETGFALSLEDATGLHRTLARGQIRIEPHVAQPLLVLVPADAWDEGGCL